MRRGTFRRCELEPIFDLDEVDSARLKMVFTHLIFESVNRDGFSGD